MYNKRRNAPEGPGWTTSPGHLIMKTTDKPHVYFIQRRDTLDIKIGCSNDPYKRLQELSKKEPFTTLSILYVIPYGGYELEKELHERFSQYNKRGEWFKPHADLTSYLDTLKKIKEQHTRVQLNVRVSPGLKNQIVNLSKASNIDISQIIEDMYYSYVTAPHPGPSGQLRLNTAHAKD